MMSNWKARLVMILAMFAMVLAVSIPAMAQIDEDDIDEEDGVLIVDEDDDDDDDDDDEEIIFSDDGAFVVEEDDDDDDDDDCTGIEGDSFNGDGCIGLGFADDDDDDDDDDEVEEIDDIDGIDCFESGSGQAADVVCFDEETGAVVFED